jgi:hypothetical protein
MMRFDDRWMDGEASKICFGMKKIFVECLEGMVDSCWLRGKLVPLHALK